MEKDISHRSRKSVMVLLLLAFSYFCTAQNADIDILKNINRQRTVSGDGPMATLTNSVYPVSAAIPIAELVTGFAKHDSTLKAQAKAVIEGGCINFVVTFGLKYAVNRPRPYVTYSFINPYKHNKDASFPSGHSSFSFNTATSLFLVFPKWYVAVPAYAWASSVAYSRMYLGMHYPSDILAGAIVGAGSALLASKGNLWLRHHKNKHSVVAH